MTKRDRLSLLVVTGWYPVMISGVINKGTICLVREIGRVNRVAVLTEPGPDRCITRRGK